MHRRAALTLTAAALTMTLPPTPARAAAGPDSVLVVLRHTPGAVRHEDGATPAAAIDVALPGGRTASMTPAWLDLVGDLQARLVQAEGDTLRSLHAEELDALGLSLGQALARALQNVARLHGAPHAHEWNGVRIVNGATPAYDSSYFLDRAFWHSQQAGHPQGLVVAVPRTDLLVFAPAEDAGGVAALRRNVVHLRDQGGDVGLSSGLYLFRDGRWSVFQEPAAVPAP
jgi:hypothetical protein